jgi:hypothetical protein
LWTGSRAFGTLARTGNLGPILADGTVLDRAFPAGVRSAASATATASGKVTAGDRRSRTGSRHITWPVLSSAEAAAFTLTNPSSQRIRTLWNGYDNAGSLVAQQEIVVEPATSVYVVSDRDLPQISTDGGHWETVSESPISGAGDVVIDSDLATAVESEALQRLWEFDSNRVGSGGQLWFVNPSEGIARLVLAVVSGDQAVASQQVYLAPHMGTLWSFESLLAISPDLANVIPGSTIVVQIMEGSVAAGLRANAASAVPRSKKGEWVH